MNPNNLKRRNRSQLASTPSRQNGMAVLGIVVLLLLVVGLLSMTATRSTILETKMVFNLQDKQRSLTAADSVAQFAWKEASADLDVKVKDIVNNDNHAGYYVLGDKISTDSYSKINSDWSAINKIASWPWDESTKRFEMAEKIGGAMNPMKLKEKPQYVTGIHNPVPRKGTAGYQCIPVSIIGASKGGTDATRTLIELKAIPKSGCFFGKIK